MLSIGLLATVRWATARASPKSAEICSAILALPVLDHRPSAASSACVAIHSLHRST